MIPFRYDPRSSQTKKVLQTNDLQDFVTRVGVKPTTFRTGI